MSPIEEILTKGARDTKVTTPQSQHNTLHSQDRFVPDCLTVFYIDCLIVLHIARLVGMPGLEAGLEASLD